MLKIILLIALIPSSVALFFKIDKFQLAMFKSRRTLSLQIARVKGIRIRLHYTLIIVFFLVTFTVSIHLMPEINPGLLALEY